MFNWRWTVVVAAVALGGMPAGARVLLSPTTTVSPRTPTGKVEPPTADFQAAVADLSSEDFKVRQTAQAKIAEMGCQRRDWFAAALTASRDTEAKTRLKEVLDGVDDELAVTPPDLTLHLDKVDCQSALQAISDQMQMSMRGNVSGERYSLDVTKRAFGEVYGQLCKTGLSLTPIGRNRSGVELPKIYTYQVHKGFTTYFSNMVTSKSVDAQGRGYQQTLLTVGVMADPRIHVLYSSRPAILHVADSAGNVLLDRKSTGLSGEVNDKGVSVWQDSVGFPVPEKPGDRIASVKGETEFVVGVGEESRVIVDVASHSGEKITVGDWPFVLEEFAVNAEGQASFSLQRQHAESPMRYDVELTDAKGNMVLQRSDIYRTKASMPANGPLKMRIAMPVRMVRVKVPFELKDVAYPH